MISYQYPGGPLYRAAKSWGRPVRRSNDLDDSGDIVGRLLDALATTPEWAFVRERMSEDEAAHQAMLDEPDRHCRDGQYQRVADWYEAQEDAAAEDAIAEEYHRTNLATPHSKRLVREHDGSWRPPMMQYPAHRDAEPIKHARGGGESFYDAEPTRSYDTRDLHEQQLGYGETGVHPREGSTHYEREGQPVRHAREDHYEPDEYWDQAGGGHETAAYQHVEGASTRPPGARGHHPEDEAARVRFQKRASELATARALADRTGKSYEHHLARAQRELADQGERIGPAPLRRRARYCKSSAAPGVRGQSARQFSGGLASFRDAALIGAAAAKCGCTFEEMMSAVARQ
jgi:hypothetical protein